jgi:hypothetical protein
MFTPLDIPSRTALATERRLVLTAAYRRRRFIRKPPRKEQP